MKHALRTWDGQLVDCKIISEWWVMRLVSWKVDYYYGDKFLYTHTKIRWYPKWRVYAVNPHPTTVKEKSENE